MAKPVDLSVESFDKEVLEEGVPVLVDFWSQTCPHCLQLGPQFDKAAAAHAGQVKFCKISVQDNAMPVFSQHRVSGVPTMILFRDGKEVARRAGSTTADNIAEWLKKSLSGEGD